MNLPYRFHPLAVEQQEDIWLYTFEQWGEAQADRYIDGLHAQLVAVIENPVLLRKLPGSVIKGVRFFRYERHYIFVKAAQTDTPAPLYVLSILHDSMDVPSRLEHLLDQLDETWE